jgi:hypothetical protein
VRVAVAEHLEPPPSKLGLRPLKVYRPGRRSITNEPRCPATTSHRDPEAATATTLPGTGVADASPPTARNVPMMYELPRELARHALGATFVDTRGAFVVAVVEGIDDAA